MSFQRMSRDLQGFAVLFSIGQRHNLIDNCFNGGAKTVQTLEAKTLGLFGH